jgi:hypothetical protein
MVAPLLPLVRRRSCCLRAAALASSLALAACCGRSAPPEPGTTASEAALQGKGTVRTRADFPNPTTSQLERKKRSEASIREEGLPVLESLPLVDDPANVEFRTSEAVAQRTIAAIIAATKATNEDPALPPMLVERFAAKSYLSPEETAFLAESNPSNEERAKFSWRYEGVHVLLWSIGYLRELLPPDTQAQVDQEVSILRDKGAEAFIAHAKLRPADEIVEQLDFYYRAHWAATDLRLKGTPNKKLNEEIVQERHRALNWLVRFRDQAWDDVTTDT